ncbi:MAG: GH1 family beta-glucosidase [Chthoniobacteraceae bacterium]
MYKSARSFYVFPSDFVWGVATAAPQIEGAAFEDGKGESTWDHFSRIPGKICNGDTLDITCDHYHRFPKDFALMRELGIRNYRLSLSWPRIYPEGAGTLNPEGIDFYKRVFDSLHEYGITPWVTMFHWDLPQALERVGGWRSRHTVDAFARYADTIVKTFGDHVSNWITLNEIIAFTRNGYGIGRNAPGLCESESVVNQTYHHALLCHGHGVRAVREYGAKGSRVGLADNPRIPIPLTDTEKDRQAARTAFREENIRVLEPLFSGEYTPEYQRLIGQNAPKVCAGDFHLISLPTDFLGLNIYAGYFVREGAHCRPEKVPFPPSYPKTDSDWFDITPEALYWGPRMVHELYGVQSVYITENGCGYADEPVVNGHCYDLHRRDLLRNYLKELHRAISEGVPVKGYFLWSFMDNFEWGMGTAIRFGLCHVDYQTLQRTPKLSARWYSSVIQRNQLV